MAEKTEEPTPKKLEDARKKGNVAQSRDLSSVAVFVAGVSLLGTTASATVATFVALWHDAMVAVARGDALLEQSQDLLGEAHAGMLAAVAPFLAVATFAGLAVTFGQVGPLFSTRPLQPDLKKLNPLSKLKQWLSPKGLVEMAKSLVKLTAVGILAYVVVRAHLADALRLTLAGPTALAGFFPLILKPFLWSVVVVSSALALGDYFFQRWQYNKGLRMSKDEVKQEFKNSEGDPEIKGERKALHREMANDVGQAVKKSAAVVVNPTHVAVALEYERGGNAAPRVVAKGRHAMATTIRRMARQHGVPVVRDVTLARALHGVELDAPVPAELYEAVAEVLLFVWRLKEGEAGR